MATDNDVEMLKSMGNTIIDLQIKYKAASFDDQAVLITPLKELLVDYDKHQARLLKAGTITTDEELAEMRKIQQSISAAASRQELLIGIARVVALIAMA